MFQTQIKDVHEDEATFRARDPIGWYSWQAPREALAGGAESVIEYLETHPIPADVVKKNREYAQAAKERIEQFWRERKNKNH